MRSIGLLGVEQRCLRLRQRFARRGQRQFVELPHPRLGLGDRALRLHHGRLQLAGFQRDQRLALADPLALLHQHVVDGAGDLAADLDPERRLDMAAGDHRLDQIAAHDLIDDDGGPEDQPRALPAADAERHQHRQHEPSVRPDRRPCGGDVERILSRKRNRLFDHFGAMQIAPDRRARFVSLSLRY